MTDAAIGKDLETVQPKLPRRPLHVVGIGASAGGLEALRELFRGMPPCNTAFVVVMHLSPTHESHLESLLQLVTKMPVTQVRATVPIEPNHIYVIPPNANLDSIDSHLRLSELEVSRSQRAPINHFLETLAATRDGRSIGVILTGLGTDGSLGIRQIKECGGLTIAQDPQEALYDSMPRSAIATGMIDLVISVKEMGRQIERFCSTEPQLPVVDEDDAIVGGAPGVLDQILAEVRLRTGHELKVYKRARILKHLRKRMQLLHVTKLNDYFQLLRSLSSEAQALCNDLILTVTEFFREAELFSYLEQEVFTRIFGAKISSDDRFRIWSLGCSTGEEAYSLAILLLEGAEKHRSGAALQVFASDLSSDALTRARGGIYPEEALICVSDERRERFFVNEMSHYRVRREVRDVVVFAAQNLFKDPPYAHLDMIVCRNLLCDLQPAVRRAVLSLFYYALEPHGALVLGEKDEMDEGDLFVATKGEPRVYRRTSGPRQLLPALSGLRSFVDGETRAATSTAVAKQREHEPPDPRRVHAAAMEPYSLPSLLLNSDNHVVHHSARVGQYLRIPGGTPTTDVLQLVRKPLDTHLRIGLEAARTSAQPWQSAPLVVVTDKGARSVVIRIDPVASDQQNALVVFDDRAAGVGRVASQDEASEVADLRAQLDRTSRRLIEVLDNRQGENQTLTNNNANLHHANDDLRGVLRELESSREELEAANEELVTLDEENRRRLDELSQISTDLQYLLESTGVATIFLDRELNIIRFTPQVSQLIHVRHADIGRPIADLSHELRYDSMLADAQTVLGQLMPVDREVETLGGKWYLLRMLPYRTTANRVDGVVITLIDISVRKSAESVLRDSDRRKDEFLAVLAHELRNPLAPLTSGMEILKTSGSNAGVVQKITAIMSRQTQQLVRLVDDLLEVSRMSSGKLNLRKAPVQLADLVRDATAAVGPLIQQSRHELLVCVPDEPLTLDADAARLSQVLANLLNNAARYTPEGGRIAVIAEHVDTNVLITVRDNGVGLTPVAMANIFRLFYQASGSDGARNAGLGIGLTLAKSLVEMHGGSISASSAGPNQGAEFVVTLPLSSCPPPAAEESQLASASFGRRVLIIDDNTDAAETLSALMRTLGSHEVRTASNGMQGLEIGAELRPEIVLLDLMMPKMDGFAVAQRIRQEPWGKDTTLVALSGWGQEEHRKRTRDAGFDRHMTKPADLEALKAILANGAAQPENVYH